MENIDLNLDSEKDKDYSCFDEEGFFICLSCKERLEADIQGEYDIVPQRVPIPCKCMRELRAKRIATENVRRLEALTVRLRQESFMDPASQLCRFEFDDGKYPEVTEICKKYVEHWPEMSANNYGIIFYGGVGTGKSFYANCIANALLDNQVSVIVATIPYLINRIQGAGFGTEKMELFERLQQCSCLVIDDLGADRGSEYVIEQVFTIVDSRYRSDKPLIVTTNLAPEEITSPSNLGYKRIYDRLLESCMRVKVTGPSRRTEISVQKKEQFKNLLGL